jgi:DNA repair ATPase RecN
MRPPEQLLYDSEASLRLVDQAIEELDASGADLDVDSHGFLVHVMGQPGGFAELSRTLLRAYAETFTIVQRIRDSCDMADSDADRLQQMHGRLREVSAATENASNGILDLVTRSVVLVERIETAKNDADRKQLIGQLKEALNGVPTHLQFQDLAAQQLGSIATLLSEMRKRIAQIAGMFAAPLGAPVKVDQAPFDHNAAAAAGAAPAAQAVADEIFAVRAERKTA